ncbi:glycosyltransferase [Wenyingzhuangia aestuarii]|uniref:glycosyltransferase n=1 Tax=Wenyingzhuangia aestuarii TaxID=1647582 RepID=UPI00143B3F48|nr:glycosyltransferase [Wenyingzhuangia aestuarii]NJB83252.1 glycosyltransferase involved in cell wall biosynthesis [Wenyingzhuangia aestuarii]
MKIIHVVATLDISAGGPSRSVPQTCEYLSKQNVNIELIARPSNNPVKVNTSDNFRVKFKSIFSLILYGFSLNKKEIELIHLQQVWDPYIHIMAWFARLKGIPYIVTPRGMLEPWIMNHNPLKKKLGMLLYQRKDITKASCIHVTCKLEEQNVRKLGFKNKIKIIPNGMDLSLVPEKKVNYGTKKITFLSRIHKKKGIEVLLEAWKELCINDWVLEIAGDGEKNYINSLDNKIKNEDIKNVSLVGPMYDDSKWNFIKEGDVFVLPTYSENFGIVVAEALVVGVPVITTQGTPWNELEEEKCGWWIDLTKENLKRTLLEVINKPEDDLKKMGERGENLIRKRYDIVEVASNIKQLYENISS